MSDQIMIDALRNTALTPRGLLIDGTIGCRQQRRTAGAESSLRRNSAGGGGCVVQGGKRILEDTGGYYMEPTIITQVLPAHTIVQKEVFGPVLAVTAFVDEDDAIKQANCTDYGLAGGVWTADLSRAHRMVREMRTGVVHVNTYGGPDVTVPMGGVKQSGNGHDKSLHAFDKYVDLKTAWIKL